MTTVSQQHTREKGERLARVRLEKMGFRVVPSDERGISFHVMRTGKALPVQVKAIRYGNWQFTANRLMDVSVSEAGAQTIHGRKQPPSPNLICVLVKLDSEEFFILKQRDLYDVVCTCYENWLRAHDGRRPRKPESMHCSARPIDLAAYQDNWALLDRTIDAQ